MIYSFNNFDIKMTKNEAKSCSHSGRCDEDVYFLSQKPAIKKQIEKIAPELIRIELNEYGAWDEEELKDDIQNIQRILWIAAGNIHEEFS
jgi:hypothetical protein